MRAVPVRVFTRVHSWLCAQVLAAYKSNSVEYVEFSVGWGDLIERPWVFNAMMHRLHADGLYLRPKHNPPPDVSAFAFFDPLLHRRIGGVEFRFLGGFPRTRAKFPNMLNLEDGTVEDVQVTYVRNDVKHCVHRRFHRTVKTSEIKKLLQELDG